MADALKAEGNKAFSAKDYATAVYVSLSPRFTPLAKRSGRDLCHEPQLIGL